MTGHLDTRESAIFAFVIGALGMAILLVFVNALTAWLTLAAMWAAAGLTDLVVDRLPNARATQMQAPQAF